MKKYQTILADPPWLYDDARTSKSMGMARSAYECMSLDDLKALPIPQIADDDCLLFLWATMPKLKEALELIEAWGFRYITCAFVWVKQNPSGEGIYSGLGHWVNGNAELVLLGKKGRPQRVAKNVKQIVLAPRGEHSAKPSEVRERIDRLVGAVPKVELFARETALGWDALGNSIDGKDIREVLGEIAA